MTQPERYVPQKILPDEEADKKCRDVAQVINDHLASIGEQASIGSLGALIFAAVTSGRTALTTRDNFLLLAGRYFDEGAADRRRNLN